MSAPMFSSLFSGLSISNVRSGYDNEPLTAKEIETLREAHQGAMNVLQSTQTGVEIIGTLISKVGMAGGDLDGDQLRDVGWLVETLGTLIATVDVACADIEGLLRGKGYDTCGGRIPEVKPCHCVAKEVLS